MKKNIFILASILFFIACNNSQELIEDKEVFTPVENNFGKTHNELLDNIFTKFATTPFSNSPILRAPASDLIEQAVEVTLDNIKENYDKNTYEEALKTIKASDFVEITPDDILDLMPSKIKNYYELSLDAIIENDERTLSCIKSDIKNDASLSTVDKQKLFDMIDICTYSNIYWSPPQQTQQANGQRAPMISFRNQLIIGADALWFWQAGLASGLNPIVTIGVSAVGSAAAYLNTK